MVPIAAEDYSGYDAASYYAVAIARRMDSHLTIFNLKRRLTLFILHIINCSM